MKPTNDANATADPATVPANAPTDAQVSVPIAPIYTPEQIEEFKTHAATAQEKSGPAAPHHG